MAAMKVLDSLECIVQPIDLELYVGMQQQALLRIAIRDADDWPVFACSMVIGCPVWTEDADFSVWEWRHGRLTVLNCISQNDRSPSKRRP